MIQCIDVIVLCSPYSNCTFSESILTYVLPSTLIKLFTQFSVTRLPYEFSFSNDRYNSNEYNGDKFLENSRVPRRVANETGSGLDISSGRRFPLTKVRPIHLELPSDDLITSVPIRRSAVSDGNRATVARYVPPTLFLSRSPPQPI